MVNWILSPFKDAEDPNCILVILRLLGGTAKVALERCAGAFNVARCFLIDTRGITRFDFLGETEIGLTVTGGSVGLVVGSRRGLGRR